MRVWGGGSGDWQTVTEIRRCSAKAPDFSRDRLQASLHFAHKPACALGNAFKEW